MRARIRKITIDEDTHFNEYGIPSRFQILEISKSVPASFKWELTILEFEDSEPGMDIEDWILEKRDG